MGLKIYKNTPQKKIRRNPWVSGVQIFPSASQFPATFATFARQKYLEVVVHLRDGGSSVGDLFEHGGVAWTRRGRTSDWWIFHDLKRSLLGWNTTSSGRTFIWLVVWKIFFRWDDDPIWRTHIFPGGWKHQWVMIMTNGKRASSSILWDGIGGILNGSVVQFELH